MLVEPSSSHGFCAEAVSASTASAGTHGRLMRSERSPDSAGRRLHGASEGCIPDRTSPQLNLGPGVWRLPLPTYMMLRCARPGQALSALRPAVASAT